MSGDALAEMSELPPPLDTIRVPSCFSPSNFADLLLCPLSVLHGLSDHELLPPHPRTILGTLIHKVMDRVRRTSSGSAEAAVEKAIAVFDELLTQEERRLSNAPSTRNLVPLRRAVGRTAWRNRLASLKAWVATAAATQRHSDRTSHSIRYEYTRASTNIPGTKTDTVPLGTERQLVVPELRLSGRPDYIERDLDRTIHVTDLKTGPVLDREGRPDHRYALQVRLYALMLERVEPGVKVRLWLEGPQRIEVPWDDTIRAAVSETLEEASALLPEGKLAAAEAIASTGPHCWTCRARHRCPSYLREAPNWWARTSVVGPVAPFDVWGQALETELSMGRVVGMKIRDAAGRRVRLRGLESRVYGKSHSGAKIWFFNLEPSENLPSHGIYTHPRNYHGVAPSRAWPDALRLTIYVGHANEFENTQ